MNINLKNKTDVSNRKRTVAAYQALLVLLMLQAFFGKPDDTILAGFAFSLQQSMGLIVFALLAYSIILTVRYLDRSSSRKRKESGTTYSHFTQTEYQSSTTTKANRGIGTGIIQIFQQIKNNLEDTASLEEGYRHLLSLSCEHLGFDAAMVFINSGDSKMSLRGYWGIKSDSARGYHLENNRYIQEICGSDVPRYIQNLSRLEGIFVENIDEYRSAWLLPLVPDGTPIGIILFLHKNVPEQIEYYYSKLDFVGVAAGWFYENHKNQQLVIKENIRNKLMIGTSLAISSSLALDDVCNILTKELGEHFGCSYSYVMLYQDRRDTMYVQSNYTARGGSIFDDSERYVKVGRLKWFNQICDEGRPVLLDNIELELHPQEDLRELKMNNCTTALIAPLQHAGKKTGVLVMVEQRDARRSTLNNEMVDLSAALVAQSSAAIENAQLYESVNKRIAHVTTMFEVGQALNSDLDLLPFINRVLNAVSRNFKLHNCLFLLRDFDKDELYIVAFVGNYPESLVGQRFKIGREGITGHVAATGQPQNIGDVSRDNRFIESTGKTGSELALPAVLDGEVVGVLDVEAEQKYAFSEKEQKILQSVMDQVAVAIEKIRLKQQKKERAEKLSLTNNLVKKLSEYIDPNHLLSEAVLQISKGFGFDLVAIFKPLDNKRLKLEQQSCRNGEGYEYNIPVEPQRGPLLRALTERKSSYTSVEPDRDSAGISDIGSRYCLPLSAGHKLLGILDIQDKRPGAFTRLDISALQTIAEFLSILLNNISLYANTVSTAERLKLVDRINQAISSTLDLNKLFDVLVHSLSEITGYYWANLIYKEKGDFRSVAPLLQSSTHSNLSDQDIEQLTEYLNDTAAKNKPTYFNIMDMNLGSPLKKFFKKNDITFLAISPLRRNNLHVGFLLVGNPNAEGFRSRDYQLLHDVSCHLEIAINNAMLYSELKSAYDKVAETQEKLIQNEKFKALGEVAAGIVHDFKNILAAIVGRVQLLNTLRESNLEIDKDTLDKGLKIIEKSAEDGIDLLSRINEFTRRKESTQYAEIILNEIIEDSIEMTRHRWDNENKNIEIKTDLQDNVAIKGNRTELIEVFTNLIINAVDAMEEAGTISIIMKSKAGKISVIVSDTGAGIPTEKLKRIFDPYFTTKGRLGTGLGLSMVYAIINRHSGEISVSSKIGVGTSFRMLFPEPGFMKDDLKISVLVVEDDGNLRNVLYELLEPYCKKLSTASNYKEAISFLECNRYDLLLTDLGLPDFTGGKLIDHVQSNHTQTQIVAMTGWSRTKYENELRNLGIIDVFKKPFDMERIIELIETLKQGKKKHAITSA